MCKLASSEAAIDASHLPTLDDNDLHTRFAGSGNNVTGDVHS